jgi:hypothetical protein
VPLNKCVTGLLQVVRVRAGARQKSPSLHLMAPSALLALLCISGCSSSIRGPITSTPTPPPTSTPTLTPLVAEHGWTIVAPLGYVSPGVVTSGTTFVAEKPYQVAVVCEGKGNLTITMSAPEPDVQVYSCTPSPQTFTVVEFHPQLGQQVHINVSADPSVVWQGALETQQ